MELNLLDLKPTRNINWENGEGDLIVLLKPKFSNRWLAKLFLPRMKRPHYRIKLDDFGSLVWNCCDGKTTVRQIGASLQKKFGDKVEPVYERLGVFLRQLEENKFVIFQ